MTLLLFVVLGALIGVAAIGFIRELQWAISVACYGINMALRRGLGDAERGMIPGELVSRDFVVVQKTTIAFDVIRRICAKNTVIAVVARAGEASPETTTSSA